MGDYDVMIKIAGELEGSFKNAIKGAQTGLSGLGVSGKVGGLALKGVGLAAKATMAGLTAAGAGIAAVGAYSLNVGRDFEAQMSTVAAISGATEGDLDALTAKAKEMGATTSFSATEAGQAMEYMSMAGWKTQDMLGGIGGIMNLAAASGEDLAMTSDIVTDAMTAFGMKASESGHFADVLAAASSNANTNVAMLGESFKYAAPVAGALGISSEDTSVALGLMANAGIKASSAGTALRTGLTNLSKPTKQMQAYMDKYNISMVENEDGSINLRDTMIDLRKKMGGLSESEQAAAASAIFGKNSMAGWLAIVNGSDKDFKKLTKAIDECDGAAEDMAKRRLDNLEGDITLLKSAAEAFGISVYENMNLPLRHAAQYGQKQLGILQKAMDKDGFSGLTTAIGGVLSDAALKIADAAPDFVDSAADLVESFLDGIDSNSGKIGGSVGKLIDTLGAAVIRLAPKLAVTGTHLLLSIGNGILDNLPLLKGAALNAVDYLWNAVKDGFKSFGDFLGDDSVAPFKKVLAMVPLLVGGFAAFDGIGGAIKGFVTNFKSAGKSVPRAAKGVADAGSQMSAAAKNFLAVGGGIALAAGGMFLLVKAAEELVSAGPGAVVALTGLGVGIAGFMGMAALMGPKLESAKTGLLAFGGAILMAAGGMALMSFAAVQIAQAGPLAFGALALMTGGMIGLMAVAGAFGTQLATAAPGLLAFGGAVIMVGAGFALMSYAAIQLSSAGVGAVATFALMAAGMGILMGVAAALGPALTAGAVGMVAFGAALVLAGVGMTLLTNAAIQISAAGPAAGVALAALMAGMVAFGAAAGLLAPVLLTGAAAIAALGAAFTVVSAAALLGSTALSVIAGVLPQLSAFGMSGATAIVALGASMTVFAAGAALAGAGAGAAALGFGALALAAAAADLAFAPLTAEMAVVSSSIATIASSATTAAAGLTQLSGFGLSVIKSMAALALAFPPVTSAVSPMASAMSGAASGTGALAASLGMTAAAALAAVAGFTAFTLGVTNGMNQARTAVQTGATQMQMAMTTGMVQITAVVTSQMSVMVSVVRSGGSQMVSVAVSTASGIRSAFNIDLSSAGRNMMQGLLNGMNSMKAQVEAAARDIAQSAASAVNNALQVHSPSRLMMQTGQFTGEGLALGMEDTAPMVRSAAFDLAEPVSTVVPAVAEMQEPARSAAVRETAGGPPADRNASGNTPQETQASFTFNPTYIIQGNADKSVMEQAAATTKADFERWFNEMMRKQGRTGFA